MFLNRAENRQCMLLMQKQCHQILLLSLICPVEFHPDSMPSLLQRSVLLYSLFAIKRFSETRNKSDNFTFLEEDYDRDLMIQNCVSTIWYGIFPVFSVGVNLT